nr:hemolysin III family protein [Actinosynnema pretiosum]
MTASTVPSQPSPALRPRMRGWLHLWSFVVSVAMAATLVALAATTVSAKAAYSTTVYGITLMGLFGVSALYHRVNWKSVKARTWMKRMDHSMIFVFIAGSYTPFALTAMPASTGYTVLWVVWLGALGGVALKMLWPNSPRWLGVPIYIALGWVAVFTLPDMLAHAGVGVVALIIAGGLMYTIGAVFYATRWPNFWPDVFGYHEFFHAMTVLAASCHCVAIWLSIYS